jgi:hypothetical protein
MTASARPAYRFSDNAGNSNANEYGNHILKRGAGEVRKPSWNRTETVVRFLPQWDFASNQWVPFRCSPAPMDFGDWIRCYQAVRGFGESGITMLLFDPVASPAYDMQSNPCVILYRAIQNAISAKQCEPDWPALLMGGNNRRAVLGRHGPIYLARCGIFRIKSKDMATADRSPLGLANNDAAYFLEMPKTVGEKLIGMLEERIESFQGEPDDPAGYKHGDIVSLDAGAYVHIFEEGADPRQENQYNAGSAPRQLTVGSGGRGNYGGGGGGGSQFKGYDLFIEPTWKGFAPQLNTQELERLIKSKQKPWDDCLQFYSHQEQAHLVQDGFPASAILYAWRDHPDWIKDETRSKAVNRVSVPTDPNVRTPNDNFRGPGLVLAGGPAVVVPPRSNPATGTGLGSGTPAQGNSPAAQQSVRGNPAGLSAESRGADEAATAGSSVKVGGWGQTGWDNEDGTPARDNVVPQGLPEGTNTAAADALPSQGGQPKTTQEQRAMVALEAARQRAPRRSDG